MQQYQQQPQYPSQPGQYQQPYQPQPAYYQQAYAPRRPVQPQQPRQLTLADAPSGHTVTYTYDNPYKVNQAVATMAQMGYRVISQTQYTRKPGCLGILFLGIFAFARTKTFYTVTFQKA